MPCTVPIFLQSWTRCQGVRGQTSPWRRGTTHGRVGLQRWTRHVSDCVVDCSGSVWRGVRLHEAPSLHARGSKRASRCAAPQPGLTPYTRREMARGQIANENRITAGTFRKIPCWERLDFPYRQPMSRYRMTMFADTDCGIVYHVRCTGLNNYKSIPYQ